MRHELTLNGYQDSTDETAIYPGRGTVAGLIYVALGLGEVGEIQGKVKKILRDNGISWDTQTDDLPDEILLTLEKELGDALWYVARFARELNRSLSFIGQANLDKLADRADRGVLQGSGDDR